jgi:hypothetical protein
MSALINKITVLINKIKSSLPQDWKTSYIGNCLFVIGVILAVLLIWAPPEYKQTIADIQGKLAATCVILAAYGFRVAADGKSVPPPINPPSNPPLNPTHIQQNEPVQNK